ncbi:MAG: hypothetical protein SO188_04225 [Prevotella sp.]|nr:hypothetical protein [Prevotella sp.]
MEQVVILEAYIMSGHIYIIDRVNEDKSENEHLGNVIAGKHLCNRAY